VRVGLITDIHANLEALETILRVMEAQKVDYLACLGDVVGYGSQPNECCELVRKHADVTVLGNHDAAVTGRMDYSYYRLAAREALDWHRQELNDENLAWLASLPYNYLYENIEFCHGSPVALKDFEYVFVLDQMRDIVASYESRAHVTFIGHSHLCKSFSYDRDAAEEILTTRFTVEPERKYVITGGSVGQPRDYDTRSCCGIYDLDAGQFEYHRIDYDIEAAARKIFATKLSVAFGKRLFLGV